MRVLFEDLDERRHGPSTSVRREPVERAVAFRVVTDFQSAQLPELHKAIALDDDGSEYDKNRQPDRQDGDKPAPFLSVLPLVR